jgi:hypothetical protein
MPRAFCGPARLLQVRASCKFRLRTLLIVLALGPPVLAGAWFAHIEFERSLRAARRAAIHAPMGGGVMDADEMIAVNGEWNVSKRADGVRLLTPPK